MKECESSSASISGPVFLILLSLSSGQKHGYAILKEIEEATVGEQPLSTSTLYRALNRLERQGLVSHVPVEHVAAPGLPRKVYRLTSAGQEALEREMERLHRITALVAHFTSDTP